MHTASDAPSLAWGRVLVLTIALAACSVTGLEVFCQAQGYRPSVPDSMELWYFRRQQVDRANGKVLVFLGSSRIMADISLDALRESLPDYRIVQLGMSGAVSCIGLLQELSRDPNFKGTVVCELDTPLLERRLWEGYLDYRTYRPRHWRIYSEGLIWASLTDHLVVLQRPFRLDALVGRLFNDGRRPVRGRPRIRLSREAQWDFAEVPDLEELRRNTTARYVRTYAEHDFPSLEALSTDINAINAMVRKLQKRGGQVVFLRVPSTGERWQLEESYHSKKANWDRFAASTDAICIHFRDIVGIADLKCPDESHLDYRDAPVFTRAVLEELKARGWSG
jgi:hypothetical protein